MSGSNTVSRLRHRLTLQQEVQAPDGAGGYTQLGRHRRAMGRNYSLSRFRFHSPWLRQRKSFGGQLQAEISRRILLRYRSDITPAMRLVYENRLFNIRMVADLNEKRDTLQLLVQEGVAT